MGTPGMVVLPRGYTVYVGLTMDPLGSTFLWVVSRELTCDL